MFAQDEMIHVESCSPKKIPIVRIKVIIVVSDFRYSLRPYQVNTKHFEGLMLLIWYSFGKANTLKLLLFSHGHNTESYFTFYRMLTGIFPFQLLSESLLCLITDGFRLKDFFSIKDRLEKSYCVGMKRGRYKAAVTRKLTLLFKFSRFLFAQLSRAVPWLKAMSELGSLARRRNRLQKARCRWGSKNFVMRVN